jgi:hypothetical protein
MSWPRAFLPIFLIIKIKFLAFWNITENLLFYKLLLFYMVFAFFSVILEKKEAF